ncbi:MAG: hypothetical protein J6I96_01330 [Oscillospiraceae bacterium]|nr:hypothetical protein [Oscillospiraceae bacterium]
MIEKIVNAFIDKTSNTMTGPVLLKSDNTADTQLAQLEAILPTISWSQRTSLENQIRLIKSRYSRRKLRFVEERVRNDVAHEIVYVSKDMIIEKTKHTDFAPNGLAPANIVSVIIKVFSLCGVEISHDILSLYDRMNKTLVKKLK